jgi:PAS domain S-box-containing protein
MDLLKLAAIHYALMNIDEVHLNSLFEHATEGIILTDSHGNIVVMNPAAQHTFGYTLDEITGKPIETLIPQRFSSKHHQLREGFYHHPQNRVMGVGRDLFGKRKDGSEIPVEVSLSFYKRNEELFVIAFIVDITRRKEVEKSIILQQQELEKMARDMRRLNTELEVKVEERTLILKEALQRLEESQTELSEALSKEKQLNEIKSSFVSLASHEFRTPLSTVLSSAALLSKYTKTEEQDKREKHVKKIKDSVKHLNDLLDDFLSLGKLNEGKVQVNKELFALHPFIEEIVEEMRPILREGQEIVLEDKFNTSITTDKKLLRNILINLVGNAVKFSGENKNILVRVLMKNNSPRIEVIDQGIGIPKEDLEHMFTSFFRSRNAVNIQGTGLGLHIVKRYADLLNASISIESELGRGTTVCVQLNTDPVESEQ